MTSTASTISVSALESAFNNIPTHQTLTETGPGLPANFTITYTNPVNGTQATTGNLAINVPASGGVGATASVQNALQAAIASAGPAGGTVTVSGANGGPYTITFGGNLAGVSVAALTTNSTKITASVTQTGLVVQTALFTGTIIIDSNNPNILFLGTGETDNSPDSFYGTGVYESTNAGQTWSLVTGDAVTVGTQTTVANPFYGKGISSMVYDPNSNSLYVADGDGGTGQNEIQQLTFNGFQNNVTQYDITVTYNGVQYTTPLLTWDDTSGAGQPDTNDATTMQNALDTLLAPIGGSVQVIAQTPQGFHGHFGSPQFNVIFQGGLAQTTIPLMSTDWPQPGMGVFPPTIGVQQLVQGGPLTVVNGTSGNPGVWRIEPGTTGQSGAWLDLSDIISTNRSSVDSANANDLIYGPAAFASPNVGGSFPNTPGPDDNYEIAFPQNNDTWTSLALVNGTLFAALGRSRPESGQRRLPPHEPLPGRHQRQQHGLVRRRSQLQPRHHERRLWRRCPAELSVWSGQPEPQPHGVSQHRGLRQHQDLGERLRRTDDQRDHLWWFNHLRLGVNPSWVPRRRLGHPRWRQRLVRPVHLRHQSFARIPGFRRGRTEGRPVRQCHLGESQQPVQRVRRR